MVARFSFVRRNVSDQLEQQPAIEPVDPFEGSEIDRLKVAPWPAPVDGFSLVESADGFLKGIVAGIADAADQGHNAGLGQALGVFDRDVLHAPIGVADKSAAAHWRPLM